MNSPPTFGSILSPVVSQHHSDQLRFGILDTPAPTSCGPARFGAGLAHALSALDFDVSVVGADESPAACADSLNHADVAVVQHEFDPYGGADAGKTIDILVGVRVPSVLVVHTVPKNPTAGQRQELEELTAAAGQVVVMSEAARQHLCLAYSIDRRKITTIPHGATAPGMSRMKRPSRPTILTWGWLAPGCGVERVIGVMASLRDVPGRPRYLIAGPTHPGTLAADGEAYREALTEQVRCSGLTDSVTFDPGHYDGPMLAALMQQSSVVVLPSDSTDRVTCGVLVEAIANGRPVVATAFPHAGELLGGGAGVVVAHDDSAALASALRQVLTQPRLAGSMAAEARALAPSMDWPVVAGAYVQLAQRLRQPHRPASFSVRD